MWLYILIGVLAALIIVVVALCVAFVDNKTIEYEAFGAREGEKGIKIAHLSDLHFPRQAVDTEALMKALEEERPDIVAVTGDLVVRSSNAERGGGYAFMKELCGRFPVYFVQGNHDYDNGRAAEILTRLTEFGAHVLDNRAEAIERDGKRVLFVGVSEKAELPVCEGEAYTVLLDHRPERAVRLVKAGKCAPDLVLCGHAHGGQFRIFGRGLFAPGQGVWPKYTSGEYRLSEKTRMIVSRGIGKSEFPFRFNDPPHVPVVTIYP